MQPVSFALTGPLLEESQCERIRLMLKDRSKSLFLMPATAEPVNDRSSLVSYCNLSGYNAFCFYGQFLSFFSCIGVAKFNLVHNMDANNV